MAANRIDSLITERYRDKDGALQEREIKLVDAIIRAIEAGASVELAAESAGVARATIYNWISRGEEHADTPAKDLDEAKLAYVDFLDRFTRARAGGKVWHIANIRKQAEDDWRASAFFLERSDPENWARRDKTHHSGSVGFTPAAVDLSKLEDDEVEKLESLLAKAQEEQE